MKDEGLRTKGAGDANKTMDGPRDGRFLILACLQNSSLSSSLLICKDAIMHFSWLSLA